MACGGMTLTHLWLFASLFFVPNDLVEGLLRCPPTPDCSSGECPPPPNCMYGLSIDYCGRVVCAKGPGEVCGTGMFRDFAGSCGDGMFCRCGKCLGCYKKTLECYSKTCVRKDDTQ